MDGDIRRAARCASRFHEAHRARFGFSLEDSPVQIVSCRLQAVGLVDKPAMAAGRREGPLEDGPIERRRVYFGAGAGWVETPVYRRDRLPRPCAIGGPAIMEGPTSTTLALPRQTLSLDPFGTIELSFGRGAGP